MVQKLLPEIYQKILLLLPTVQSLNRNARVCRSFRIIIKDSRFGMLWKKLHAHELASNITLITQISHSDKIYIGIGVNNNVFILLVNQRIDGMNTHIVFLINFGIDGKLDFSKKIYPVDKYFRLIE